MAEKDKALDHLERDKVMDKLKRRLFTCLRKISAELSIGGNPYLSVEELAKINNMDGGKLLQLIEDEEGFCEHIDAFTAKLMRDDSLIETIVPPDEIAKFEQNMDRHVPIFIKKIVFRKLNFFAQNQGIKIVNPADPNNFINYPDRERIKKQIITLLAIGILKANDLYLQDTNPELKAIFIELVDMGQPALAAEIQKARDERMKMSVAAPSSQAAPPPGDSAGSSSSNSRDNSYPEILIEDTVEKRRQEFAAREAARLAAIEEKAKRDAVYAAAVAVASQPQKPDKTLKSFSIPPVAQDAGASGSAASAAAAPATPVEPGYSGSRWASLPEPPSGEVAAALAKQPEPAPAPAPESGSNWFTSLKSRAATWLGLSSDDDQPSSDDQHSSTVEPRDSELKTSEPKPADVDQVAARQQRAIIGSLPTMAVKRESIPSDERVTGIAAAKLPSSSPTNEASSAPGTGLTRQSSVPSLAPAPIRPPMDTLFEGVEDKENSEVLNFPVVNIVDAQGKVLKTIPLYSSINTDTEHHVRHYYIGTDPLSDVIIDPLSQNDIPSTVGAICFYSDTGTMMMRAMFGVIGIKGTRKVINGDWRLIDTDSVLTLQDPFAGQNASQTFITLEKSRACDKAQVKEYLLGKVDTLIKRRALEIADHGPASDVVKQIDAQLEEIFHLDQSYKINAIDPKAFWNRIAESVQPFKDRVLALRQRCSKEIWKTLEEQVKAEELRIQEKRKQTLIAELRKLARQEEICARCEREGLKDLHLLDHENPETCEIVYRDPVFVMIDPDRLDQKKKDALAKEDDFIFDPDDEPVSPPKTASTTTHNPFLLHTYKFGKHKSCFREFKELPGGLSIRKAYKLSDFMAGLRYNPVLSGQDGKRGVFTLKLIAADSAQIRKLGKDSYEPIMKPSEEIDEGDDVLLGRFHLSVERGHGYTAEALHVEAMSHINEMIEVVFDTDTTTEAMDREAFANIEMVLQYPLPTEKGRQLRKSFSKAYLKKFDKLYRRLSSWSEDKPLPDAKLFHPVLMSVKLAAEGNTFMPRLDVNMTDLQAMALYRAKTYTDAGRSTYKKLPILCRFGKASAILGIGDKRISAHQEAHRTNYIISRYGAVEIARFVEEDLVTLNDLGLPNNHQYLKDVERILKVRSLLNQLQTDRNNQLDLIKQLSRNDTGGGLRMIDIYGEDEINIINQDVTLHLKPELAIADSGKNSFVAQLANKIANKAYAKIGLKTSARERQNEMDLLIALIEQMKLVDYSDLLDMSKEENRANFDVKVEEIKNKVGKLKEKIADSLRREEYDEAERQRVRQARLGLYEKDIQGRELLQGKIVRVTNALAQAKKEPALNTMEEMIDIAGMIHDADLEKFVSAYWQEDLGQAKEQEVTDADGNVTKVQIAPLKKTWADLQQDWHEALVKNATKCLFDATDNGTDAYAVKVTLEDAIERKILTWAELKVTPEIVDQAVLLEKFNRQVEDPALAAAFDDFTFLINPFSLKLDPALAEIYERRKLITATKKLQRIAKMITEKRDDPYYCKLIAQDILAKFPEIRTQLANQDFALLQ